MVRSTDLITCVFKKEIESLDRQMDYLLQQMQVEDDLDLLDRKSEWYSKLSEQKARQEARVLDQREHVERRYERGRHVALLPVQGGGNVVLERSDYPSRQDAGRVLGPPVGQPAPRST